MTHKSYYLTLLAVVGYWTVWKGHTFVFQSLKTVLLTAYSVVGLDLVEWDMLKNDMYRILFQQKV